MSYQSLLHEIKQLSSDERLQLLEALSHIVREEFAHPTAYNTNQGWPANFFELTEGCLEDDPISRPPQGEYEIREELL